MKRKSKNTTKKQSNKLPRPERVGVFKHASDKNAGRTFGIFKKETFAGDIVTPQNRRTLLMLYFMEHLKSIVEKGEVDKKDTLDDERRAEALLVAKDRLNMNKKAYKAYSKGQQYFRHKGNKYLVPTVERIEEMQDRLGQIKNKYSDEELSQNTDDIEDKEFFVELTEEGKNRVEEKNQSEKPIPD